MPAAKQSLGRRRRRWSQRQSYEQGQSKGLRGAYLEQPRPATICATYDAKAITIGMTQYSLQRKGFLSVFTAIYLLREDGKKKRLLA